MKVTAQEWSLQFLLGKKNKVACEKMKIIKRLIRRSLINLGYDIVVLEQAHPHNSLVDQLISRKISVVLDVGGNIGQFAHHLRHFGYRNRIISFEPVRTSFVRLRARADVDPSWEAVNLALGSASSQTDINVSKNFVSSSIRDNEDRNLAAEPTVEFIYTESIKVEPLDKIFPRYVSLNDRPFLKVDVQGYENEVFKGAESSLPYFEGIILECSFSSLYKGEWLFNEVLEFFTLRGFLLAEIEPAFVDPKTGELLQVNTLFWKSTR